jgi:hypothetical protein
MSPKTFQSSKQVLPGGRMKHRSKWNSALSTIKAVGTGLTLSNVAEKSAMIDRLFLAVARGFGFRISWSSEKAGGLRPPAVVHVYART